jgi:hypothetical protein
MITIDRIVTSVLLQKGYSIHWYLQILKYATDCLRELQFDTIGVVRTDVLPVNEYKAIVLPKGYVDFVKVGIPNGQFVLPLGQREGLTRINNYDTHGNKILHEMLTSSAVENAYDINGRAIGKWFGYNTKSQVDSFKVLEERNEIQLDERLEIDAVLLEWISDGSESDNASKVDPYAQKCIERYVDWQLSAQNRSVGLNEAREKERLYKEAYVELRGRRNGLTIEDIKASIHKGTNIK